MAPRQVTAPRLSSPGLLPGLLCIGVLSLLPGLELRAGDDDDARRLYSRAQKLLSEGESEEALERFQTLGARYRRTEWSALALWEIYRIAEQQGAPVTAFAALDRLVTEQPGHFQKAHAAQFQLVKRLLGAGREARRTLEPVRPSQIADPEIVADMLRTVIRNGPQSDEGIQAHYYLGLAQEKAGEKKAAVSTHEDFAENYPKHELADDAGYQVAYIAYKDWKSMRGTGPHQREAAAVALTWFLARYPESDKAAQARSCLWEVREAERLETVQLARYYEVRGNQKAADIYYRHLAQKFPEMLKVEGELKDKILKAAE